MTNEEKAIHVSDVLTKMRENIEEYNKVLEADAEIVKRGRLKRIQIEIGRNANDLKKLTR